MDVMLTEISGWRMETRLHFSKVVEFKKPDFCETEPEVAGSLGG